MLHLSGPHTGKCARLLTLTNTSSPDYTLRRWQKGNLQIYRALPCSSHPSLLWRTPCFWDEPMLVLVSDHRGEKAPSALSLPLLFRQHLWQTVARQMCVRQQNPSHKFSQSTFDSFDTVQGTGEPHAGRERRVPSKLNRLPVRK